VVYNSQSLFTTNIYIKIKIYIVLHTFIIQYNKVLQYIQASFSPGFVQQITPYLLVTYVVYRGSLRRLNSLHMTAAKFDRNLRGNPLFLLALSESQGEPVGE
jgi:hypothetical protein